MKISKLFHWLYAILMLLPFAFFVPSVLYYAFNDNATMQSVEVPKTETVAVDFNQQVKNGDFVNTDNWRVYNYPSTFNAQNNIMSVTNSGYNITSLAQLEPVVANHKYYVRYSIQSDLNLSSFIRIPSNAITTYDSVTDNLWHTYTHIVTSSLDGNTIEFLTSIGNVPLQTFIVYYSNINIFDLTKMYGVGNEPTIEEFETHFPNGFYPYTESKLMQITYDLGESEQLVQNTDIINYAWESIWNLPLFSWTKVTFVSVPFSYLTGIFGIGANNSLNYVFGYFVTISIVWLVFDLLLYVPMLAHNWIDKARIE